MIQKQILTTDYHNFNAGYWWGFGALSKQFLGLDLLFDFSV